MTALNKPQLQKPEPGDRTQESGLLHPATGISETSWQIIIFAISMVVILFSVYCLSHGITIIFMHLYYLPIVLLAYRYRYRGFVLSVILSLAYIVLVLFYSMGQNEIIIGALFRFVVFIGIAAVVAYLSEQFHQSEKSLKKVADIQESSLMNANVWLMLLDRRGRVLLWNNAAERISGYSAAEVTGSNNIWKLLYPDKDYRAVITKKIERIIAEDSFFENLETTIRSRSGEEKVISWNTRSFPGTSGQEARSIAIGIDITGRKVAEDQLIRKSEELAATGEELKAQFDALADSERIVRLNEKRLIMAQDIGSTGCWEYDLVTGKIWGSAEGLHLFGFPPAAGAFPIVEIEACIPERERVHTALIDLISAGKEYNLEYAINPRDGSASKVIHSIARLERDAQSNPLRVMGIIQDITERKRVEDVLAESEEKYRNLYESSADGIASVNMDGHIIDANNAFCAMTGYTLQELEQLSYNDLTQERWHNMEERILREQVVIRGFSDIYEKEYIRKDGSIMPVALRTWLLRDNQGDPLGMWAIVRDIKERKLAEEALRKNAEELHAAYEELTASQEELHSNMDNLIRQELALRESDEKIRLLLNSTAEAIYGLDMNGNCTFCNNSCLRLLGYKSPDELLGRNMHWQIHAKHADGSHFLIEECRIFQAFNKGEGTHVDDEVLWRSDGTSFPAEYWSYPQRRDGVVVGAVVTFLNISERKQAEDALLRVNQKLNVLSQLTRKDLANQIFVLNSYLELAKHQLAGQDNIIETVQKGVRSIQSIHETIEYSKDYQDMGAKPPKWQNVKMALLFGLSHISIGNIQHSLETENLEIFADPLLEKVCQRLFENSVKHGDHVAHIRVSHTVTPEGATIFFEDNGIGIPQEKKEQIFLRSEGTRVSMRSLIFVREILDITGITIRETGEPGKGARFEMTVPKGAWRIADVQQKKE